MSTEWVCHYSKNTPGYDNQFNECWGEVMKMLWCPTVLTYTGALDILFSGHYPPAYETYPETYYNTFFNKASGFYFVQVSTGVTPNYIQGAEVDVYFKLGTGVSNSGVYLFSGTGMITDSLGRVSGYFDLNTTGVGSNITGLTIVSSGELIGSKTISCSRQDFNNNFVSSFSTDATTSTSETKINISRLAFPHSGNYYIDQSTDGTSFSNVFAIGIDLTTGVDPWQTVEIIYTGNLQTGSFYYYNCYYIPELSVNPISSPLSCSGGYPPAFSDISLTRAYNNSLFSYNRCFKLPFQTGKLHQYETTYLDQGIVVKVNFSGEDGIEYEGSPTTSITGSNLIVWLDDSQLPPLSSTATGTYLVSVSGRKNDSYGNYFYAYPCSETFNLNEIELLVTSGIFTPNCGQSGCGLDLSWYNGINGYYYLWSGTTISLELGSGDISSQQHYYVSTTGVPEITCGTTLYFKVCAYNYDTLTYDICSNIASAYGAWTETGKCGGLISVWTEDAPGWPPPGGF